MKVGDLVKFINEGTYAKWFFYQFARVESISYHDNGIAYCRVSWLFPIEYYGRYVKQSDFRADKFEVCK